MSKFFCFFFSSFFIDNELKKNKDYKNCVFLFGFFSHRHMIFFNFLYFWKNEWGLYLVGDNEFKNELSMTMEALSPKTLSFHFSTAAPCFCQWHCHSARARCVGGRGGEFGFTTSSLLRIQPDLACKHWQHWFQWE